MILVDAGPLIGLLDHEDAHHQKCVDVAATLSRGSLLTSWPCFTEAMHILGRVGGFPFQAALWKFFWEELAFHDLNQEEMEHMQTMMKKYQDKPMDLADASLLAIANFGGPRQVFTLDSDFRIYRLADGTALEIIP